VAAHGEVSGDEIFRFWKLSSNDQSGRQNMINGGLWKQWWEKRGTTVFGEKFFFSDSATGGFKNHNTRRLIWL
jgi:hypothetical protein